MKWAGCKVSVLREAYGERVQFMLESDKERLEYRECHWSELKPETLSDLHALSDCMRRPPRVHELGG